MKVVKDKRGQLLLEVLLAVAISATILGISSGLISLSFTGGRLASERNIAAGIADEVMEAVRAIAFEDWTSIYDPPATGGELGLGGGKDASVNYHVEELKDTGTSRVYLNATPPDVGTRWGTNTVTAVSAIASRVYIGTSDGKVYVNRGTSMYKSASGSAANSTVESRDGWEELIETGDQPGFTRVNDLATTETHTGGVFTYYVLAVGDAGKVSVWNDSSRTRTNHCCTSWLSAPEFYGASVSENTSIHIVGAGGNIFWAVSGDSATPTWLDRSRGGVDLYAVSNTPTSSTSGDTDMWVVGENGTVAERSSGAIPSEDNYTPGAGVRWGNTVEMRGVSVAPVYDSGGSSWRDVWVVGDNGTVWRCHEGFLDGACEEGDWSNMSTVSGAGWGSTSTDDILSVSAYAYNNVYIVGEGGDVWNYDGTDWTRICGSGNWNSATSTCDDADTGTAGTQPVRWGTTNMRDVSDHFSSDVVFTGASGNLWKSSPAKWQIRDGSTTRTANGVVYTESVNIHNVCRTWSENVDGAIAGLSDDGDADNNRGDATSCGLAGGGSVLDPSTQMIKVTVSWARGTFVLDNQYITRWKSDACYLQIWGADETTRARDCLNMDEVDQSLNNNIEYGGGGTRMTSSALQRWGDLYTDPMDLSGTPEGASVDSIWFTPNSMGTGKVIAQLAASDSASGSWDFEGRLSGSGTTCTNNNWYEFTNKYNLTSGDTGDHYFVKVGCTTELNGKRYLKARFRICSTTDAGDCSTGTGGTSPNIKNFRIYFTP